MSNPARRSKIREPQTGEGMSMVVNAWESIERWYKLNLPEFGLSLGTGATEETLLAFEAELAIRLPDEVRESYRVHDGSSGFPLFQYGYELLALHEVAKEWHRMKSLSEGLSFDKLITSPTGPIAPVAWNLAWIPIVSNGNGDFKCVDLAPAPLGTIGQIISYSHEEGPREVLADRITDWLISFSQNLERGLYYFDELEGCLVPHEE